MKYSIIGNNLQLVSIELKPGEKVYAEAGGFVYKSENVQMKASAKGGITEAFKRVLTAESFFVAEFFTENGEGIVGFGPSVPGKIKPITLKKGQEFIAERDAFLCAEESVSLDIKIVKAAAAIFGGEGIILQKLKGPGAAFINVLGDMIEYSLEEGQVLEIARGHVAGFEPSVEYDVRYVGDIKTAVFGGSGLLLAKLTGPGTVYLQSMTKEKLINELGIAKKGEVSGGNINIGKGVFGTGISGRGTPFHK